MNPAHLGLPDRRVRLLYVAANFVTGGAERHLLEMWSRIDRTRFEVRIACLKREGAFTERVEGLGLPVVDLGVGRRIYDASGVRGGLRLISLIREFRPDIVHGYLFGPNLLAALAGRACAVPVVCVAKRNVDAFETPRQIAMQRLAHRLATHVTAVSEEVARTSVALGVPRGRVTVIENGVDVARFDGESREDPSLGLPVLQPGEQRLGAVGCLAPRKDLATLFAAVALLRERDVPVQLVVAGEGPERPALEALRARLGLTSSVHLLGERSDVDRLLPAFDVFTLSSREEGIPNALLEAMAAARPCVVTRVGGNAEVLQDGRTGWLVPPQDPRSLADALHAALTDRTEAAKRGNAARAAMIAERSIDAMVRRHESFYLACLGLLPQTSEHST